MASAKTPPPLVCHGHTRPIVDLQYSLETPDGVFLASASKDGQPMLRRADTGDWVGTFVGHKGAVWACTLNDAALIAATASADFSARVWNAVTGDELCSWAHRHIVRCAAFSRGHSQARLVTGGPEKLLRVFDLQRPEAEPSAMPLAPDSIRGACWVHDNSALLVHYASRPGVDVWDLRSGGVVRTLETRGAVGSVDASADGRSVVVADGQEVRFLNGRTFDCAAVLAPGGCTAVESAALGPLGNVWVAGGADMWVHVYGADGIAEAVAGDASAGAAPAPALALDSGRGHHGPVHCVRFHPDGRSFASGSEDGTIRIWSAEPYAARARAEEEGVGSGGVESAAFASAVQVA